MAYTVTYHAAVRYRQRVNQSLRTCEAKRELADRAERATLAPERPPWVAGDHHHPDADGWLMLDESTAAVVRAGVIVTVATRDWADRWVRRKCAELGWTRGSREPSPV